MSAQGTIENGTVEEVRIRVVGRDAKLPSGVIDAAGRFVMPGLIDAHSHTAVEGSVNECTAEARISVTISLDLLGQQPCPSDLSPACPILEAPRLYPVSTASITPTVSFPFPFTSAATITGASTATLPITATVATNFRKAVARTVPEVVAGALAGRPTAFLIASIFGGSALHLDGFVDALRERPR